MFPKFLVLTFSSISVFDFIIMPSDAKKRDAARKKEAAKKRNQKIVTVGKNGEVPETNGTDNGETVELTEEGKSWINLRWFFF